ncbi:MAG: YraN family protein [Verrucomicrobiota bacterium]
MRWPWQKKDSPPGQHLRTGLWGEQQAADLLAREGYRILGRRVRVGTRDELDIVARQNDVLVFVEVKTRRREDFGSPMSSVNRGKRHAQSRAALRYMERLRSRPAYFRFDVVEVVGTEGEGNPEIRHIENAFTLDARLRVPW